MHFKQILRRRSKNRIQAHVCLRYFYLIFFLCFQKKANLSYACVFCSIGIGTCGWHSWQWTIAQQVHGPVQVSGEGSDFRCGQCDHSKGHSWCGRVSWFRIGMYLDNFILLFYSFLYTILADNGTSSTPVLIVCNKQDETMAKGETVVKALLEKEL